MESLTRACANASSEAWRNSCIFCCKCAKKLIKFGLNALAYSSEHRRDQYGKGKLQQRQKCCGMDGMTGKLAKLVGRK